MCYRRVQHALPTRRSSDLVTLHVGAGTFQPMRAERVEDHHMHREWLNVGAGLEKIQRTRAAGGRVIAVGTTVDRKSTRLNSSHVAISYAVFCLTKKKMTEKEGDPRPDENPRLHRAVEAARLLAMDGWGTERRCNVSGVISHSAY